MWMNNVVYYINFGFDVDTFQHVPCHSLPPHRLSPPNIFHSLPLTANIPSIHIDFLIIILKHPTLSSKVSRGFIVWVFQKSLYHTVCSQRYNPYSTLVLAIYTVPMVVRLHTSNCLEYATQKETLNYCSTIPNLLKY